MAVRGGGCWNGKRSALVSGSWTYAAKEKNWPLGIRCVINTALVPEHITLFPRNGDLVVLGFPCQFRAIMHYACGRTRPVQVTWTSQPARRKVIER